MTQLNITYVVIGYAILCAVIITVYFLIKPDKRPMVTTILSILAQSIGFISLFFLLLDKIKQNENEQKMRVSALNDMTNTYMTNIINSLSGKEKDLRKLYEEIFEDYPSDNKPLSYQENLFLYQVFNIFLNVYRQYTITGGDQNLYDYNMYDSWDTFIKRVVTSAKVKNYWLLNKKLFNSLKFIEFMDIKYFTN
jgi:hypothetical protein